MIITIVYTYNMMKNKIMKFITKDIFEILWDSLLNLIEKEYYMAPYSGLIIARVDFKEPFIRIIILTVI